MKPLGMICELNPFHNGHRYLIEKAKTDTGCDAVVAVMSGNFTQRGLPALTDKRTRAAVAVANGVDLVLELPAAFSVQSARHFAQKGVQTLSACGIINTLAFGSESGDLAPLIQALDTTEGEDFSDAVRSDYKRSLASAYATSADDEGLFTPNNILGIEYLRALRATGSGITPYTCRRIGVAHDADTAAGAYASASYLRKAVYAGKPISDYAPEADYTPASLATWEALVLYRLRTIDPAELEQTSGVSEGLHNRILTAAKSASSYEELVNTIKTKRYTRTRIERILTCAVLGIKSEYLNREPYLRVLAATETGLALIREIQKTTPVIVKTADAPNHPVLSLECRADDVYALLFEDKRGLQTYHHPPVIIKD